MARYGVCGAALITPHDAQVGEEISGKAAALQTAAWQRL
jgi:hypothetical protein